MIVIAGLLGHPLALPPWAEHVEVNAAYLALMAAGIILMAWCLAGEKGGK